jgi:tRNA(Arg) A34 adenosine deaminase TadA
MSNAHQFMQEAIRLSRHGMQEGAGGPFGCVIVKDNQIIGRGWNQVTSTNDPTAHAEVVAIRDACHFLGSYQLEGCEVYASCEPCPMCFGAIYWARPSKLYFANTRQDAAAAGFDDALIYEELELPFNRRRIITECLGRDEALQVFEEWKRKTDKTPY